MKVLGPELFELDPDERFTVRIECEGGAYLAFGNVNKFKLVFNDASPEAAVTPAVLAGPHSVNRIHLHLVYSKDTPAKRYHIRVIDAGGKIVDSIDSTLNPGRTLPYRVDVDLVAQVD
jgi:hypothetical protein